MLTIEKKHEKSFKEYLNIKNTPGKYEEKLWKKVNKYKFFFQYIPGIVCVCIGNSLAMNAANENSDIDLFIITKKNRLWTSRIYFTLLLMVLRQRKTSKKHAEKFCLSFFITQNAMNLEDIAIENDIYLKYWLHTLVPIVNKNHTFEKFISLNNEFFSLNRDQIENHSVQKNIGIQKFSTRLGDVCEKVLQTLFLPRTKKSFQKLAKPFGVIISDDILKFHDKDKRKEIRDTIFS